MIGGHQRSNVQRDFLKYTSQQILKAMQKPGLTIEQVFKEVRVNVARLSGGKQNTWDSSNITGEFYFKF